MSDILSKILSVKADEVSAAKKYCSLASLRREVEAGADTVMALPIEAFATA